MPNQHRLHAQPEKTTCLGSPTIACAQPNKKENKPKPKKQTKTKKSWVGSHTVCKPTKKKTTNHGKVFAAVRQVKKSLTF